MPVHAPEFPSSLTWFNVAEPIALARARGRPVLLDFFTPGCINCIHTACDVTRLERLFGHQGLLCVRVLSPKFPHEATPQAAREFIDRYGVASPLVLDHARVVWDAFAVRAWPTFVLLDERGYVSFVTSGEGKVDVLAPQIETILKRVARSPGKPADPRRRLQFHYPSKVCAGRVAGEDRVFVSDAGNHRVVALDGAGRYLTSFGDDELHSPQGLALAGDTLLVCDAGAHRVVSFVVGGEAGMGAPGRPVGSPEAVHEAGSGEPGFLAYGAAIPGDAATLNSPWDIAPFAGGWVLALAGGHQLAYWDRARGAVRLLAGSGVENLVDGPGRTAALAQPSGVCVGAEGGLFFVDAESSSLRKLAAGRSGSFPDALVDDEGRAHPASRGFEVETLVGDGLFSFGHEDGPWDEAQFQHCTGVAWSQRAGGLWVCDSYNGALRYVSFADGTVRTVSLSETLSEPSGVHVSGGRLFVVDSNAHRLLTLEEPTPEEISSGTPLPCRVIRGPFGVLADFMRIPGAPLPA